MKRMLLVGAVISLALSSAEADDSQGRGTGSLGGVIVADELRTAFYEHAPAPIASAMSQAVAAACISHQSQIQGGWLCRREKLAYFRSVYLNGAKGAHGLVCENSGNLRYIGLDLVSELLAHQSCVRAERYGPAYELELDGDAAE